MQLVSNNLDVFRSYPSGVFVRVRSLMKIPVSQERLDILTVLSLKFANEIG
jgi:hypothetical protein